MPISIHAANRAALGCVKSSGIITRIGGWLVLGRGFGHDREVLEGLTIDAADLSAGFLSNFGGWSTGSCHRLFEIEKSLGMRDFTGSCLTVVFAALAVSRWIEAEASWSFRKFVKTSRCNVTTGIRVGRHAVTTAGPLRATTAKYPELSRAAAGCALVWANSGISLRTFLAGHASG